MTDVDVSGLPVRGLPRLAILGFVRRCLRGIASEHRSRIAISEVSVRFVDDAEMLKLNRRFRGKRKTTDVLTFPAFDKPSSKEPRALGDVVISLEQARRQAPSESHSLACEVKYLLLHGLIHAHGYDHESDDGEMNALELKLRKRLGFK